MGQNIQPAGLLEAATQQGTRYSAPMSPTQKFLLRALKITLGFGLLALLSLVVVRSFVSTKSATVDSLTGTVHTGELHVLVTERGELESTNTVVGTCELKGSQNKIIFLSPEGTRVKKGEVVCRFDPSEIEKQIAKQEIDVRQARTKLETSEQEVAITTNLVESEVADAEVDFELANLDVVKYAKGDFIVDESDLLGRIALAEADLEKAKDLFDQMKMLVKKGFKSPEQLRASEQQVAQTQNYLDRDKQKLQVLREYDSKRKTTELQSKSRQAKSKVARSKANAIAKLAKAKSEFVAAKSTYDLQSQQLDDYKKQLDKCTLTAAQDGVMAYANKPWYDANEQIREGATCYSRQSIFMLPDMSKLQVKVNIHESMIKKVESGQTAEIHVDALPQLPIDGVVKTVSVLADSNRGWRSGGVKQYGCIVVIDKLPTDELKPGMTAEVRIKVNHVKDALLAPLPAITEHENHTYVYVKVGDDFEKRKVRIGDNNEAHVQILEGLQEGDVLALDARKRMVDETTEQKDHDHNDESPTPQPSTTGPKFATAN